MRKFVRLLAAVCAVCLALPLAACAPKGLGKHNWSSDWSHNINQHWHVCMDNGCNEKGEVGAHDWQLIKTFTEPTCKAEGEGRYMCTVCKATLDDAIPATGEHKWSVYSTDIQVTCARDGLQTLFCEVCASIKSEVIAATGEHDFGGKWQGDANGHYQLCQNGCGTHGETEAHHTDNPKITQPTGMSDGKKSYICDTCGYTYKTEPIPNPNVPVTLSLTIKQGNTEVEITPYSEGWGKVTLNLNTRYTIQFTATNAAGETVTGPFEHAINGDGIRAYIEDSNGYLSDPLNSLSEGPIYYPSYGTSFAIEVKEEPTDGYHVLIFRYETGTERTVRATYMLEIYC